MILISSFCIVADVYFVRSVASFKWTARTSSSASARNLRRTKKLPGLFPSSDSDSLCPGRAIFCFPQNTIQEIMLRSSFLFFAICLAVSLSMIEVIDVPASRRSEENHRLLVMQLYGIPFFGGPWGYPSLYSSSSLVTSQERLSWYLTLSAQTKHNTYNTMFRLAVHRPRVGL